jgi:hypothetical protein
MVTPLSSLTRIDARYNKVEEEPLIGIFSVWVTLVSGAGGFVDTKQNNKVELFGPPLSCIHHASLLLCQRQLFFEAADIQSARNERSFQKLVTLIRKRNQERVL